MLETEPDGQNPNSDGDKETATTAVDGKKGRPPSAMHLQPLVLGALMRKALAFHCELPLERRKQDAHLRRLVPHAAQLVLEAATLLCNARHVRLELHHLFLRVVCAVAAARLRKPLR
eukprot:SAG11_NODE_452_length_9380_cov_10.655533_4_plen_117_part_00